MYTVPATPASAPTIPSTIMLLPPPDRLKYALPPRCGMGFGAVDGDADMAAVVTARVMDAGGSAVRPSHRLLRLTAARPATRERARQRGRVASWLRSLLQGRSVSRRRRVAWMPVSGAGAGNVTPPGGWPIKWRWWATLSIRRLARRSSRASPGATARRNRRSCSSLDPGFARWCSRGRETTNSRVIWLRTP